MLLVKTQGHLGFLFLFVCFVWMKIMNIHICQITSQT